MPEKAPIFRPDARRAFLKYATRTAFTVTFYRFLPLMIIFDDMPSRCSAILRFLHTQAYAIYEAIHA